MLGFCAVKMQLFFLVTCALLLLHFGAVFASKMEFFSSVHQMSKLVQFEGVLLKHMQKYVEFNENKLEFLKARLAELESDRYEALQEGLDYFDSPVNKYLLTKRLTLDWERVENIMQHDAGKKPLTNIERYVDAHPFPEVSELEGAIAGFLRIQDVYRLKASDMAQGILDGVKYNGVIDAQLCLDTAKYAEKENQMRLAHAWALEALQRLHKAEENDSEQKFVSEKTDKAGILELLAKTKRHLGDLKGANQTYAELVALRPDVESYTNSYLDFQLENILSEYSTVDLTEEHEPLPANLLNTDEFTRYKHTCNGLLKQTPSEERDLRCGYLTETHPFLLIAPIKAEELNHDPLLVVYYDVLSDAEIEQMKTLSNDYIVRATVVGYNKSEVSSVRTSQFVFLPKQSHPLLRAIDVRAGHMSDLNMDFAEDHQFQNYGIGGHYGQHYDAFDPRLKRVISNPEMGNRIATLLFYLTDVEQGGGTAFPYLKRLLMPKKGAAAFWYNLHADGVLDHRTLHGGCPIIVGSKWVLNRWIREFVQSDRRPCELWVDSS